MIDQLTRSFGPFMRQQFRLGPRDRLSQIVASLNFRKVREQNGRYVLDWPPNSLANRLFVEVAADGCCPQGSTRARRIGLSG